MEKVDVIECLEINFGSITNFFANIFKMNFGNILHYICTR